MLLAQFSKNRGDKTVDAHPKQLDREVIKRQEIQKIKADALKEKQVYLIKCESCQAKICLSDETCPKCNKENSFYEQNNALNEEYI